METIKRSLLSHWGELRHRIFKSALSLCFAFAVCWFFAPRILGFIRKPLQPFLKNTNEGLVFTAPMDLFLAHLQTAFFSALVFSSPYWLHQIWSFISPGLYKKEKKVFIFCWCSAVFLFFSGALFAYFIALPFVFSVLMSWGDGTDQAFITIKNYLSFLIRFVLAFGLVFEMPLILVFLCRQGILSPQTLRKHRRLAFLILAIVSAFITPPDVMSMFLMLLPLWGLYELSLCLAFWQAKKTK